MLKCWGVLRDRHCCAFHLASGVSICQVVSSGVKWCQVGCRNEGKSAQEVSLQLKQPSQSWLDRTSHSLGQAINHDATLESWQELYRVVSALDFGTGMPVAMAAAKQVMSAGLVCCICWWLWWEKAPMCGAGFTADPDGLFCLCLCTCFAECHSLRRLALTDRLDEGIMADIGTVWLQSDIGVALFWTSVAIVFAPQLLVWLR